jgi:hypothetical protein
MVGSPSSLGHKHKSLLKKELKEKRAGSMAQVVDQLPNKCKTLSSNPRTTKINK